MKINKKTSFLSLFLAGTLVLGASAAADVIIGDGYNSAKQALKYTTKTIANDTDSFTISADWQITVDGELIGSETNTRRYDFVNKRWDENGVTRDIHGESNGYVYNDEDRQIYYYDAEDVYNVYSKKDSDSDMADKFGMTDPFDEPIAADVEKIADAFVSNMKDFVQVKDLDDGGKMYFGNLESAQIPALANALTSFALKYGIVESMNFNNDFSINSNFYLGEISAQVSQNADGILDGGVGSLSATGTDENGNDHRIEMSMSLTLSDINSTVIEPISLEGKNVSYSDRGADRFSFTEKNIGEYSVPVVEVENDRFVKAGENVLTINSLEDGVIKGHMSIEGVDSDFTAEKDEEEFSVYNAQYVDSDGQTKNAKMRITSLSGSMGDIWLDIDLDVQLEEDGVYKINGGTYMLQYKFD